MHYLLAMNDRTEARTIPLDEANVEHCDRWDYEGSGIFSGAVNMQRDCELLQAVQDGSIRRPVLRFYRWLNPTVSLGLNQKANEVVDANALTESGYDLVKRPTGGRALLHKGDLCYAISARRTWHPEFRSLHSTYRAISAAIMHCLSELGIAVPESAQPVHKERGMVNPCFAMVSPFEVLIRGRKISGSAQFRSSESFLQHGSIRVRNDWNEGDLTSLWPTGISLRADAITSIDKELGHELEFNQLEEELLRSFSVCFGVKVHHVGR
jgi:lipoate-protein ligase A